MPGCDGGYRWTRDDGPERQGDRGPGSGVRKTGIGNKGPGSEMDAEPSGAGYAGREIYELCSCAEAFRLAASTATSCKSDSSLSRAAAICTPPLLQGIVTAG